MSVRKPAASADKGANTKPEPSPEEQFTSLSPAEQSLALYDGLKQLREDFRNHQHSKDGCVELHESPVTQELQGNPPPAEQAAPVESGLGSGSAGAGGEGDDGTK